MIDDAEIKVLQELFDSFSRATGTVTALLDLEGNVLVAAGWQDICTQFHRVNPDTACRCRESDTILAGQAKAGEAYNVYQCKNGLVDVAVPVVVAGRHIANLFTGQFFFSPPDQVFFEKQAAEFGFDKESYLAALSRVPILSDDQVKATMDFLARLAVAVGEMGASKLRIKSELAERKSAEQALQASERQKRLIIETVPDLVWLKDIEGRYLACNRMFERFFGAKEEDIIGRTDFDFVDFETARFFRKNDKAAMDAGRPVRNEEWITFADDGHSALLETSKTPLKDSDGKVLGVLGVARDITERKALERRLTHAQKMEVVGQLAGGTAHDFNNLLQVIQANLELIDLRIDDNEDLRKYVESARGAVRRGSKLSQQLLSFSRQQTLYPEAVDPNDLIEGAVGLLRHTLGEDVEVRTRLEDSFTLIDIDPNSLENAILNLALNARAAMPKGGRLTIESHIRHLSDEMITDEGVLPAGKYLEISVADTGCGMEPEVLAHAFEPFFTTKEIGKGSGLGLSMVYGFTLQSNGHTTLESEVGKGTTVRMLFPAVAAKPKGVHKRRRMPTVAAGVGTILVVEDAADVRNSVVAILETLGYGTREAENGISALAILNQDPGIDLLFTDVVMPGGMNGIELAREAVRRRKGLKVLLTSGYPERVLEKTEPGAERFRLLSKPYSNAALHEAIKSVMSA